MSIARKLFVLALAVCSVMAFSSATASALTLVDEASGVTCSAVTEVNGGTPELAGGCPLKGVSVNHFELAGPFGVMVLCNVSLEGRGNGSAELWGTYTLTCGESGLAHPCTTAGRRHVKAEPTGPLSGGVAPIEAVFCADVESPLNIGEIVCHVPGKLTQVGHQQSLSFGASGVHATCENNASYALLGVVNVLIDKAHPAVEVKP